MWVRLLPVLIAGLMLAGCASMSGFPRPIIDQRLEDAELAPYVGPAAMERYEACPDKLACRNVMIDARLHAVDLAFYRFQRKSFGQEAGVSLGSNLAAMALNAVGAITATRPLAAGAGLLSGGRDAYQKQVLNASLPLLFEEMVVDRREALLRIRQGELLPVANYSLFQALADIAEYEMAGSIPAAAAQLRASTGASSHNVQARLDALRMQVVAMPVMAPPPQPIAVASPLPPTSAPVAVVTHSVGAPTFSPTPYQSPNQPPNQPPYQAGPQTTSYQNAPPPRVTTP